MIFKKLVVGIYGANCYIVGCEETKEASIIDPGGDANDIIEALSKLNLNPKYIILTHGHGDHIGAIPELISKLALKVLIHSSDKSLLENANENLSDIMGMRSIALKPDITLEDGDKIEIGNLTAEVIHTPGHTLGSISLKFDDIIITGDTLFAGSIGRTDFPNGSYELIIASITKKLLTYNDDTKIYPGHGPSSTIGIEKLTNPFVRG